jgi:hypothetical protein
VSKLTITISNVEDLGDEPWPAPWILTCDCSHYSFHASERDALTAVLVHGNVCSGSRPYDVRVLREERLTMP